MSIIGQLFYLQYFTKISWNFTKIFEKYRKINQFDEFFRSDFIYIYILEKAGPFLEYYIEGPPPPLPFLLLLYLLNKNSPTEWYYYNFFFHFLLQSDDNASFLRAARGGNLEKVLEYLKANTDINTCNAVSIIVFCYIREWEKHPPCKKQKNYTNTFYIIHRNYVKSKVDLCIF